MKRIVTMALMLTLGVASVYAQQHPVKMAFSGTGAASAVNLQMPNTVTSEENIAGKGILGPFTFRDIRASAATPEHSDTCSGPNELFWASVAGAGVFRFQDGSLLKVNLTQGGDCIDFAAPVAHCTFTFQITGGTGRFKRASGDLTLTETDLPVLADAFHNPVFFADAGEFTGTVSGVASGVDRQEEQCSVHGGRPEQGMLCPPPEGRSPQTKTPVVWAFADNAPTTDRIVDRLRAPHIVPRNVHDRSS